MPSATLPSETTPSAPPHLTQREMRALRAFALELLRKESIAPLLKILASHPRLVLPPQPLVDAANALIHRQAKYDREIWASNDDSAYLRRTTQYFQWAISLYARAHRQPHRRLIWMNLIMPRLLRYPNDELLKMIEASGIRAYKLHVRRLARELLTTALRAKGTDVLMAIDRYRTVCSRFSIPVSPRLAAPLRRKAALGMAHARDYEGMNPDLLEKHAELSVMHKLRTSDCQQASYAMRDLKISLTPAIKKAALMRAKVELRYGRIDAAKSLYTFAKEPFPIESFTAHFLRKAAHCVDVGDVNGATTYLRACGQDLQPSHMQRILQALFTRGEFWDVLNHLEAHAIAVDAAPFIQHAAAFCREMKLPEELGRPGSDPRTYFQALGAYCLGVSQDATPWRARAWMFYRLAEGLPAR